MTDHRIPIPRHPIDTEPYQTLAGRGPAAGRQAIAQAMDEAGVVPGAHDTRIARWLGTVETSTALTVAAWIARAYDAGLAAAGRPIETALTQVDTVALTAELDAEPITYTATVWWDTHARDGHGNTTPAALADALRKVAAARAADAAAARTETGGDDQ